MDKLEQAYADIVKARAFNQIVDQLKEGSLSALQTVNRIDAIVATTEKRLAR